MPSPGAIFALNIGSPPPDACSSASSERTMKSEVLSVSVEPNILRSAILSQTSRLQHDEEVHDRLCVGSLPARHRHCAAIINLLFGLPQETDIVMTHKCQTQKYS